MRRRPWPIVILALFQLFSPFVSIFVSATSNKVSLWTMTRIVWNFGSAFDRLNFFFVPIAIGLLIFFTKRLGLILICISVLFDIVNNFLEWRSTSNMNLLWLLLGANLVNLSLLVYLLLPRVRKVFWVNELRWWEQAPRYVIDASAEVSVDGEEKKYSGVLHDFSSAGAGIDLSHPTLKKGAILDVQFTYENVPYLFKGEVVYIRALQKGLTRFGVRHAETEDMMLFSKKLKQKGVPITRVDEDWKTDFLNWLKSAKSPKAWIPKTEAEKQKKRRLKQQQKPKSPASSANKTGLSRDTLSSE